MHRLTSGVRWRLAKFWKESGGGLLLLAGGGIVTWSNNWTIVNAFCRLCKLL